MTQIKVNTSVIHILEINNEMSKSKFNLLSWMCVLFYSSFVCVSAYANVYFQTTDNQHSCVRGPLRECRSIRSGASGLSYYCTPLVCISVLIGLLAVWRHNKPKTKIKVMVTSFRTIISKKTGTKCSIYVYYSDSCACVYKQSYAFPSSSILVHIHRHCHVYCLCMSYTYTHVFCVLSSSCET